MEWDLVLLVLDKIHAIVDSHENNLFNMLKETVITIEGIFIIKNKINNFLNKKTIS